jgi:short-subunit dehydrogenase
MGQVVVITGCAQGMGREVAKILAAKGVSVAGFDMDDKGLGTLEKELGGTGGGHYFTKLSVTDRKGILKFRDKVLERFGHVDTVFSNVGVGFFGPFEEVDLEKAIVNFEINVFGTAAVFQAFIPSMRVRKQGKLVAVASMVGRIPFPFESIYSSSKFAVEGLVRSLKYEVAPFGIKVALIEPSQVSTAFAAKSHVIPPADSPYHAKVVRFSKKNGEILKGAHTPASAAQLIVRILEQKNPKLHNQLSFKDSLNLKMMAILPSSLTDSMLLKHMDIAD